ncbi:MAG: Hpt domain-containing protein [Planctomycetota bacterium]
MPGPHEDQNEPHNEPGNQSGDEPLKSEFGHDPEMLDLIELFVGELSERVSKLQEAWESGELEYVRMEAHRLKGAAPGYGFSPIGQVAGRLEHALTEASDTALTARVEAASEDFERLVNLCGRVAA